MRDKDSNAYYIKLFTRKVGSDDDIFLSFVYQVYMGDTKKPLWIAGTIYVTHLSLLHGIKFMTDWIITLTDKR